MKGIGSQKQFYMPWQGPSTGEMGLPPCFTLDSCKADLLKGEPPALSRFC